MSRIVGYATLAVFVSLGIVACSPSHENPQATGAPQAAQAQASPEQVAAAFLDARKNGDIDAMARFMTEKAQDFLKEDSGFSIAKDTPNLAYTIGETTVENDTAQVAAEVIEKPGAAPQQTDIMMRREHGDWRVYALRVGAEGMSMTLDFEQLDDMMTSVVEGMGNAMREGFEQAAADWQQGGSDREIAAERVRFEALNSVSIETFTDSYTNKHDVSGISALEAISTLAREIDLVVYPGDHADALARTIETDVVGDSYLEAIERVTREVGLHPVYPEPGDLDAGFAMAMVTALAEGMERMLTGEDSAINLDGVHIEDKMQKAKAETDDDEPPANAITFAKGPRPYPVTFHGPFLITIADIEENVPFATGAVDLRVRGYGLPPEMLAVLDATDEPVTIEAVRNPAGDSLREDDNVQYIGGTQVVGTTYADNTNINLVGLLNDVQEIARLAGTQHLHRPATVETVTFTTLQEGVSQAAGDLRVTVTKPGKSTAFEITGPEERLANLQVHFAANNADGAPLGKMYEYYSHWSGDTMQANVQTPELPGTVTIKLVDIETLDYPFELAGIPLKRHAEQPEELAPLEFGDHDAPVSVTFDSFGDRSNPDFPKANLSVANHSNKHATGIQAQFHYFDADGAELDDFPHSIQGEFDRNLDTFIAMHAGQSAKRETTAFQMPPNTAAIEVRVTSVEFIDGTKWTAP